MSIKVAINGFGRIGRTILRGAALTKADDFEVVTINDLMDVDTLAYLLKYDSIHGRFPGEVKAEDGHLVVNGKKIRVTAEKDPANLPYKELGVHVALECTGRFRDREGAGKLLKAGAKRVIISAPAKGEDLTVVMGVNDDKFDPEKHFILSNASCTTNCLAPVAKVIDQTFGIRRGVMTTIHAYTNDQALQDQPHKDLRRGRAAASSMVPTTTGAARAVGLVLPQLKGKLDGLAIRVPTINASVVDLVVELDKETTAEQVNDALRKAAEGELKGVLGVTDEPVVSTDMIGNSNSSVVDLALTSVMDGNVLKLFSWYDNEWAFSLRMIELTRKIAG